MSRPGSYFLKIVLMGDGAVGKTSLRNRFMGRGFKSQHLMTIGADFSTFQQIVDGNAITYQIWDLAGQEHFQAVRQRFFRGAMGGLLVFDVTRPETFQNIPNWLNELFRNSGRSVVPIVLLGNKADLKRAVSQKQAIEYSRVLSETLAPYGITVPYMDTSAKTGLNVQEAFTTLARQIIRALQSGNLKLGRP